ncbi:hypothetical protein TEQG_07285 [Trichophyton equinum CBS 127.97]|uniref:ABC transporter domain-containing protein n=1 Tax=Trichophyton equinum (strain ATCC MYA-4606 / CBS 127.97) TaxID=559882 RepID=F2Q2E3_TRIEC|nr:hypothetical protein TEQG_07285 [Trichophyton equinum CBS 127.97]
MSTDVERITFGLRSFHEFWANTIQAGILAYLLERQLGITFMVPLIVAILSSVLSIWASHSSDNYQTAWTSYSQLRIGTISSMLSSIKPLKMRGLIGILSSAIQNIRLQEIKLANRFRMLLKYAPRQIIIKVTNGFLGWKGNRDVLHDTNITIIGAKKQKIAITRALYTLKPIILFDDVLSGLDYTGASHIFREVIGPNGLAQRKGITVIIATHAAEYLSLADHIIALDKSGHLTQQGNFQSLRSQSGYIGSLTIAENFRKETVVQTDQGAAKGNLPIGPSGDFRIYGYYFKAAGTWTSCLLLAPISALLLLLGVAYHTLIRFVSRAGSSLHKDILDVVINAPLSFFGSTDIGVTINRFSQDIQLVDNELPMAFIIHDAKFLPTNLPPAKTTGTRSKKPFILELPGKFKWIIGGDPQGERMDRSRDKHRTSAPHRSRPESPALSDLTITIEEGQKVGICGRSGSGKSFLLLLLLRLLEVQGGSITVDGLDLASLPRNLARSRFNMIPQEPVFIPGTVQFNLDPDSHLLFDVISAQGGVNSEFQPSSLSHGQRQLFCLAGAILRKSRIGLLDEITSNVDQATDELMQKIIREEFKLCTSIAIAHRLNTIMNFDRVIVLEGGQIVESGKPQDLLLRDSMFKQMWKAN